MRVVRRLLVFALLLALVGAGAALAARGDPQKKINPADQARAKAMLLRQADFWPGFKAERSSGEYEYYCKALDESDLVLTGEAESPDLTAGFITVASISQVYATAAMANTSWRRGMSAVGVACLAAGWRSLARKEGLEFVSFRRVPFPSVAPRTVAFRIIVTANGVRVVTDLVGMMHSRAHAGLYFVSALAPIPKGEQVGYARIVAGRMSKAMRGA